MLLRALTLEIRQKVTEMMRQRIYGIISGNEDLNDHDDLRRDEVFKILVGRGDDLAGSSTVMVVLKFLKFL